MRLPVLPLPVFSRTVVAGSGGSGSVRAAEGLPLIPAGLNGAAPVFPGRHRTRH